MRINPQKGEIKSFIIMSFLSISGVLLVLLCGGILKEIEKNMLLFVFIILFVALTLDGGKQAFAYYMVDEAGITEHFWLYTKQFCWSDFKYIGLYTEKSRTVITYFICIKVPLRRKADGSEKDIFTYMWPWQRIKIQRSHMTDEGYQQLLTFCGGERDFH